MPKVPVTVLSPSPCADISRSGLGICVRIACYRSTSGSTNSKGTAGGVLGAGGVETVSHKILSLPLSIRFSAQLKLVDSPLSDSFVSVFALCQFGNRLGRMHFGDVVAVGIMGLLKM